MKFFSGRTNQPPPLAVDVQAGADQRVSDQAHLLVDEAFPLIDECLQSSGQSGQAGFYAVRGGNGYCAIKADEWDHLAQVFSVLHDRYVPAGYIVRLLSSHTDTPVFNGRVGKSKEVFKYFSSAKELKEYARENWRLFEYRRARVCIEIGTPGRLRK